MDVTHRTDDEQTKLWNGRAGHAWVEAQELLDELYRPFEELLVQVVPADSARRVLDVGCGTGATTLALARRLGATGRAIGIDLSGPMIDRARARAERTDSPATFIRADAATYAFEPATFDAITSRFGVMFFDDFVQAFANLRRAARADCELRFITWRSAAENPFMTTAERAAAPLLPNIPARRSEGPGQFACVLPERELAHHVTRLGPVGLALHEADDETRTRVVETVRAAFDPYVDGGEVRFTAACWMVGARASSSLAGAAGRARRT
jgi:SAM-dependent methyltransferase